jgi:enoyl-CoA hydratase/carnithine racemase
MTDAWQTLRVWTEGPVGRVMLNRPAVLNALDYTTVQELERAVQELAGATRVIIVQGAGDHFCAGADLRYVADNLGSLRLRQFIEQLNRAFFSIELAPVPVIAAVQGYALAGGFELTQACDIVIVSEDAAIGDQHANYGLIPGGGGSQRLPRLIGRQRALSLLLTGDRLSGTEAAQWGLAYRAVAAPRLEEEALALAGTLAEKSLDGLRNMKRLVNEGMSRPLGEAISFEVETFLQFVTGQDSQEGLTAFRERRRPKFS